MLLASTVPGQAQAFEPEMDWSHFGVRVAQRDIPKLGGLLEGFSKEKVAEMQVRMCMAESFCGSSLTQHPFVSIHSAVRPVLLSTCTGRPTSVAL